ncbi:MAG: arylsulfotransferase family protein [Paracoccaceae bacterium]
MTAWAVRSTEKGSDRSGAFGRAAVAVAEFPGLAREVVAELRASADPNAFGAPHRVPLPEIDRAGFEPVETVAGVELPGLLLRADRARLARGWRILVGAFEIGDRFGNAAVLLDPDLRAVHLWRLEEEPLGESTPEVADRVLPHGFALLEGAAVVAAFDNGVTLQSFDNCGRRAWAIEGGYHHTITAMEDGRTIWTALQGLTPAQEARRSPDAEWNPAIDNRIARIDARTGEVERVFSMAEVIEANPDLDIFRLRMNHRAVPAINQPHITGPWQYNPFHINDVDPLPERLAAAFPDFVPGDLLVSARSVNLVFVLDPDTLKVRWWRIGAWNRQHDPDWEENGRFSIYNNRLARAWSEIVEIDPRSFETRRLLDGREHGFYSRIRGKHQILPDGTILVASSQQARVFERAPAGDIRFEALNSVPSVPGQGYVLSEALWVPEDALSMGADGCPR